MSEENCAGERTEQFLFDGMSLEPSEPKKRNSSPNQVAGRPKGAKNKLTQELHAMIRLRGINFLNRMWDRAERLEDEIDFRCAVFIGSRIWTKPRGNPVSIDLSQNVDARTLLMAVAEGQITPADASSLWNSLARNGHGNGAPAGELLAPRDDVREQVAGRLAGIVAARLAARNTSASSE
jgi:hypothetical protein